MKNRHLETKISFGIDIVVVIILLTYFAVIVPNWSVNNSFGGILILSPPIFGFFGLLAAIIGFRKGKTKLDIVLIIVNIIFLFWWPIFWFVGTLFFGV